MTDKKKTRGQQFVEALKLCNKKEDLLFLASAAIQGSKSQAGLKERKLMVDVPAAVHMKAALAQFAAENGGDPMSYHGADGMLYMVMAKYEKLGFGKPKKFVEDFAKAYPKEYAQNAGESAISRGSETKKTTSQRLVSKPLRAESVYGA